MGRMRGLWRGKCDRCLYWASTSEQQTCLERMLDHLCYAPAVGNYGKIIIRKERAKGDQRCAA